MRRKEAASIGNGSVKRVSPALLFRRLSISPVLASEPRLLPHRCNNHLFPFQDIQDAIPALLHPVNRPC